MVSIAEIYTAICDERSLKLFDTVATNGGSSSSDLTSQLRLSSKEYYSRMSRLMKTGMVKRKNGTHFLTAFGQIVYNAQATIKKGVESYWKLKAIDSIDKSDEISANERKDLLETLIDDAGIKTILLQCTS
jgi:predicted transcriptional regulator